MAETPQQRCKRYRRRILEISQQVKAAHVAPAFSCLEIIDSIYHDFMKKDDIFVLSKGHGVLAQYVNLVEGLVLILIVQYQVLKPQLDRLGMAWVLVLGWPMLKRLRTQKRVCIAL